MIFELHDYFKIYYFYFYNNKIKIIYNDSNLESRALMARGNGSFMLIRKWHDNCNNWP